MLKRRQNGQNSSESCVKLSRTLTVIKATGTQHKIWYIEHRPKNDQKMLPFKNVIPLRKTPPKKFFGARASRSRYTSPPSAAPPLPIRSQPLATNATTAAQLGHAAGRLPSVAKLAVAYY
jgi:hypothetical protein